MNTNSLQIAILLCLCITSVYPLFKGESFLRLDEYTVMPSAINITLTKVGTVPRVLRLSSLCSVPTFQQIQSMMNDSTVTLKRDAIEVSKGYTRLPVVLDVPECDMIGYCDTGGMAGGYYLCPGTKHHLVSDQCLEASAKKVMQESMILADAGRAAAHELTMGTVEELIYGTAKLFEKQIQKVEDILKDQLSDVEKIIVASTTQASAVFMDKVRGTFSDMAQQISEKIEDQRDLDRRKYVALSTSVNNMIDKVKGDAAALSDMIRASNAIISDGTDILSQNMNSIVDKVNLFYSQIEEHLEYVRMTLQHVLVSTHVSALPETQGEDLSPLLVHWNDIPKGDIAQGKSTGKYRFVEKSYTRSYVNSTQYVADILPTDSLEGKSLYECYEEDTIESMDLIEEEVDVHECIGQGTRKGVDPGLPVTTTWAGPALAACPKGWNPSCSNYSPYVKLRVPEFIRGKVPEMNSYNIVKEGISYSGAACYYAMASFGTNACDPGSVATILQFDIFAGCNSSTWDCWGCITFEGGGRWLTAGYGCPYYDGVVNPPADIDSPVTQHVLQKLAAKGLAADEDPSFYPRQSWSDGLSRTYIVTPPGVSPNVNPEMIGLGFEDIFEGQTTVDIGHKHSNRGRKEVIHTMGNTFTVKTNGVDVVYHKCSKIGSAKTVRGDKHNLVWTPTINAYIPERYSQEANIQRYSDKGGPIYLVDRSDSILPEVTPATVGFVDGSYNYRVDDVIVPGIYHVNGSKDAKYVVVGNNNFYLRHPERGNVRIHKCRLVPWNRVNITAETGAKPVAVLGLQNTKYIGLLTTSNHTNPSMRLDKYVYTTEKWCCSDKGSPMIQAGNCTNIALTDCPSKQLNNVTTYLSPRSYYCAAAGKNTVPVAYGIDFCNTVELPLPGSGVEIQTGTISPQGLYPSRCMYWTTTMGSVGIYTISLTAADITVPTMLTALRGRKVIFGMDNGEVIDEMDSIMGLGNGGYDCMTYEMDLLLHSPRNCHNHAIPVYSSAAYYAGLVRSTGLSKLQDYFIMDILHADNDTYVLQFTLRDGVDYEASYVPSRDVCPNLEVEYVDGACKVSGWAGVKELAIYLGSHRACNIDGICASSIDVANNETIQVDIVNGTQRYNCYNFMCMASEQSFVAYPTEAKYNGIRRTYKMETISKMTGYDYKAEAERALDAIQSQLDSVMLQLRPGMIDTHFDVNLTMDMVTPDFAIIANNVRGVIAAGESSLSNISLAERRALVTLTRDMYKVLTLNMEAIYNSHTANLTSLQEEILRNITIEVVAQQSSITDWVTRLGGGIASTVASIAVTALGLIICLAVVIAQGVIFFKM